MKESTSKQITFRSAFVLKVEYYKVCLEGIAQT